MEIAISAYLLIGILFAAYKMREWLASLAGEVLMFAAMWFGWPLFAAGIIKAKVVVSGPETKWTVERD